MGNIMLKSALLGLSIAALAIGLAHAQDLPARILEKKTLSIANVPNYPPLEFKDPKTGTLTGLDIDIGNAIAKKLGVAVKWEEISFEAMIPALATGRVDMILSGMSDLPSRRETMDFVNYLASGAQFYTNADRKDEFKDLTALCGKKVGASRRTSFPKEMEGWSKENCEAKGKPSMEIVGTEGSADARTQLRQKRLDAAVQGSETLPYLMDQDRGVYAILGAPFTTVYQGMAFAKKDTELRDAVAKAFADMLKDGSYDAILKKWELATAKVDKLMINGEAKN
jgi:polar amino acid transport system substrate-binding protein